MSRVWLIVTLVAVSGIHAQVQPKPAIASAKPVRSCTSLTTVALPDTTIESAAADPAHPGVCHVIAARRDQSGAITRSRPLCQYPMVAKYKGTGSTDDAANFVCSAGF
jgi:hypothetical protein